MSVSKRNGTIEKLFADSICTDCEEENKRMEQLNQKYEDEKIKVAEKNQKIKEINDLAASEHREKTHSEKDFYYRLYKMKWIE